MNKIQKEFYQAPELTKIELNHLSILLSFSVEGTIDDLEAGVEDEGFSTLW